MCFLLCHSSHLQATLHLLCLLKSAAIVRHARSPAAGERGGEFTNGSIDEELEVEIVHPDLTVAIPGVPTIHCFHVFPPVAFAIGILHNHHWLVNRTG